MRVMVIWGEVWWKLATVRGFLVMVDWVMMMMVEGSSGWWGGDYWRGDC